MKKILVLCFITSLLMSVSSVGFASNLCTEKNKSGPDKVFSIENYSVDTDQVFTVAEESVSVCPMVIATIEVKKIETKTINTALNHTIGWFNGIRLCSVINMIFDKNSLTYFPKKSDIQRHIPEIKIRYRYKDAKYCFTETKLPDKFGAFG